MEGLVPIQGKDRRLPINWWPGTWAKTGSYSPIWDWFIFWAGP